jgi:hypothetical protein
MELATLGLLCLAALLGGMVNSVAGGGTLLTFPALIWAIGNSATAMVLANATSTVALLPGSVASAWGYRRELAELRQWVLPLLIPSVAGATLGTLLVVKRDPAEFQMFVPWLILTATLLFLLQPAISRGTGIGRPHQPATKGTTAIVISIQFCIALYGGYFGAGIGILMLSALAMMGISSMHQLNALKTMLASAINFISVVLFIGSGLVQWKLAIPMIFASIIGGYVGAVLARRLDKNAVRYVVIAIGIAVSVYYFWRQLQPPA